jgi:hypothetical protein
MATKPFVIVPSLTAIAVAYLQAELIADMVLPRVPVDTESFRYIKYEAADAFSAPNTRVGRKSAPNQLEWGSTELTDSTNDEGLDTPVPNSDIEAWQRARAAGTGLVSQVDPLSNATELVTQTVLNRREVRTASLVNNLSNYATANKVTLATTGQWSDYANSDPLPVIMDALDSMIMRPNIGWMGRRVATKLRMHPKVCKAVFGNNTDAGIVPLRALADQLELDEIYVGSAWVNTAAPGQPAVMSRVWGNDAGFMYRNMRASTRGGVTFGFTAQYGDRVAGTIEDSDIGLRGGQRVRMGESVKELLTANDLGYLFKNAVAAS